MTRWLAAIVIAAAGIIAYANSTSGVFVFDDRPAIVDNPHVRTPDPWAHPVTAMQAPRNVTLSGRPIASLSFALNYALAPIDARNTFDPPEAGSRASAQTFARNAWGYHAANVAIHICAALALFGVLRRTFEMPQLRPLVSGASTPLACAIALLWTVHPLQTASVTYLVQRVESLMGLFFLLTMYCAIRGVDVIEATTAELKFGPTKNKTKSRARSDQSTHANAASSSSNVRPNLSSAAGKWTIAAVVACALGMGTKETMVTAPIIVALWDWTFLPGSLREIVKKRWPLYAGLAATWIILALLVAMNPRPLSAGFGFSDWPWWRYVATQAGVVVHYLRLSFVPTPLVLDYDWRPALSASEILMPGIVIVALVAGTLLHVVRRRAVGFAGAFFFLILAPSSSILPIITEVAAEHRMYLPLAALVTVIVISVFVLTRRWLAAIAAKYVLTAAVVVLAISGVRATQLRNSDYGSSERIWADSVQKQPRNARARNNYAFTLLKSGQARAAAEHLNAAVTEVPDYAEAHANLGLALGTIGDYAGAVTHFERALSINPFYTSAYENLAQAYALEHQPSKAVKYFLKALDQKPDDLALLNQTGWILATSIDANARDGAQALVIATHAVQLTERRDASSLDTLAAAHAENGQFDMAIGACSEALTLARARGDRSFNLELEERISLYRAKKPFRR